MAELDITYISSLPTGAADGTKYLVQDDGSNTTKITVNDAVAGSTPVSTLNSNAYLLNAVGTEVPQNADLNNYTTPGVYNVPNNTRAQTLSNKPSDTGGFKLTVEYIRFTSIILQTAVYDIANEGVRIYNREYNSGWTNWIAQPYRSEITAINSNLPFSKVAGREGLFQSNFKLVSTSNEYAEAHKRAAFFWANATARSAFSNIPSALASADVAIGIREVFWISSIWILVRVTEALPYPGRMHYTFYNSGTWTSWTTVVTS